jgi:hypothetical protein
MRVVNELLEDDELLETVPEAQAERLRHSRTRGRKQTPAGSCVGDADSEVVSASWHRNQGSDLRRWIGGDRLLGASIEELAALA